MDKTKKQYLVKWYPVHPCKLYKNSYLLILEVAQEIKDRGGN